MDPVNQMIERFPDLEGLFQAGRKEIHKRGFFRNFARGETLYSEGERCESFSFILTGLIRVYKMGEGGRAITLYRVGPGECCFLTASCVMQTSHFPAIAECEESSEAFVLPAGLIRDLVRDYRIWQDFVFSLMAKRLTHMASTLDNVAFQRFDIRLGEYLIEIACRFHCEIETTHQKIADELGTAREVVSRTLKEFEKLGFVKLSRGIVKIVHVPRFQDYIRSLAR